MAPRAKRIWARTAARRWVGVSTLLWARVVGVGRWEACELAVWLGRVGSCSL
jgi:hypothetical protein